MAKKKRAEIEYEADYDIDYDQIEGDREEAELGGEDAIPWWKAEEGSNLIRVLPPTETAKVPYRKTFLHYGLGPIPMTCPGKKICPICQYISKRGGRNHPLSGSKRVFFNILDIENPDAGVQVYSSGNTFFKAFLDHIKDEDWGDVTHPIEGFDITIDRKGTGMNTEYSIRFRRNPSQIADSQEELDDILDGRFELATIAPENSMNALEEALEVWIAKKGDDEEDETEDKPRQRKKRKPVKAEEEEEEEEKEEEEEEEEEEESDKPPRRQASRKPKKKAKVEPEEEEEEGEEEEKEASDDDDTRIMDLLDRLGEKE